MRLDLLYVARSLRRSPVSACAAVTTLALTIGVAGSIFAAVHAAILPPPFLDPDALVVVGEAPVDAPAAARGSVPYGTFAAWRDRAGSLAGLEAFDGTNLTLTGIGHAERLSVTDVTAGFLSRLGVTVARGRGFTPGDVAQPVAIVSHAFWQGTLGGDPDVVGRVIVLGARPHTIVGVLPAAFRFELNLSDIWRPMPFDAVQAARVGYRVLVIARLARGVSPAMLREALDPVSRGSAPPARVAIVGLTEAIAGRAAGMLRLLSGGAAVALLVAFVNLAGLLIVRTIDRRHELAVRRALGSGPAGLARQMLIESHTLVAIGTVAGVLLASWLTPAVAALALQQFGGIAGREVPVAWPVVGAIVIASCACAWTCGLAPAAIAMSGQDGEVLRRRGTATRRAHGWRRALVGAQLAVAFVLLTTGTLLARTLITLLTHDPGFDPRAVVMQVALPVAQYPTDERVAAFYASLETSLQERLASPVGIVDERPLSADRGRTLVALQPPVVERPVAGRQTGPERPPSLPRARDVEAVLRAASPGYFDAMAIPIVNGRTFTRLDDRGAPRRVVLDATAAARLFGTEPIVGRRLWLSRFEDPAEIVGVVGNVAHRALDERPLPTVYVSSLQTPSPASVIALRSERSAADLAAIVRQEVARLDQEVPVYGIQTMDDVIRASPGVAARRVLAAAFGGFAALAIVLSAVGLFGIAAHDVAARRGELALRIALGADGGRLVRAVVGRSMATLGAGLVAGGVLSFWSRGVLAAAGYPPVPDSVGLIIVPAFLAVVGIMAVLPAAVRAGRTDPRAALTAD